jgi:hypothetical protein
VAAINGVDAFYFNLNANRLFMTPLALGDFTSFSILDRDSTSSKAAGFSTPGYYSYSPLIFNDGKIYFSVHTAVGSLMQVTDATVAPTLLVGVRQGSNGYIYKNGSLIASGTLNTTTCAWEVVGAYNSVGQDPKSHVGDLGVYSRALADAEREALEDLIGGIYGITITH